MSGLLDDQVVAVFAATGAVGRAVAERCLAEGATVVASGRQRDAVDELGRSLPGLVWTDVVDAARPVEVAAHLDQVVEDLGGLDGVFNGIGGRPHLLGYPEAVDAMTVEQFLLPIGTICGSAYVTSVEAGSRMRSGGSIVTMSATLSSMTAANMVNISAACGAVEAMTRSLAGELGPSGIRVNCVRASAMPDTRTIRETSEHQAALGMDIVRAAPPICRAVTVEDTAATVAFLLSAHAAATTGQTLTVCGGQFV
ncbi:MAG: SDR family oxidoreductase [Actinomycetota bacterium]